MRVSVNESDDLQLYPPLKDTCRLIYVKVITSSSRDDWINLTELNRNSIYVLYIYSWKKINIIFSIDFMSNNTILSAFTTGKECSEDFLKTRFLMTNEAE